MFRPTKPDVDLNTLQARRINIRESKQTTQMPLARACKLSVHGLHCSIRSACFGELSSKAELGHDDVSLAWTKSPGSEIDRR